MGAEFIEVTHKSTREQLHKWYPGFVDKQAYENGHGGYSGSFAEKRSVEMVPVPEALRYWDLAAAEEHAMDHNDKWGPAFAYEVDKDQWYIAGWASS